MDDDSEEEEVDAETSDEEEEEPVKKKQKVEKKKKKKSDDSDDDSVNSDVVDDLSGDEVDTSSSVHNHSFHLWQPCSIQTQGVASAMISQFSSSRLIMTNVCFFSSAS